METIDNELLSERINQTGLNYSELSREINISRNTLYNISLGRTFPRPEVINSLVSFLEITEEDFIAIFYPNIEFKKGF